MSYFDEEYDYDTLANDADYIDDYDDDDQYNTSIDDGLQAWENYYHNIASEIDDEQLSSFSQSGAIRWDVYSLSLSFLSSPFESGRYSWFLL